MKAILLAAGRGERMRPLTDHTPKPLLPVGGKPLIVWHIENLVRAGIRELVVNHAHLGVQIEEALGDGSRFGAEISYSREASALETAGGIAYALPLLGAEPFAAIASDIYCDYDFAQLVERAQALRDDDAHLVMVPNPAHHPDGDFGLHDGRVTIAPPRLTFSGIGVYRPALFGNIMRGSAAPLAPLLRASIVLGHTGGELHRGVWIDVGTPQRLRDLDRQVSASA